MGETRLSSRPIIPLLLAQKLNATRVVEDIWGLKLLSSAKDKEAMELFAALLNRVPRLVEIVRSFTIVKETEKIDAAFLSSLFDTLEEGWSDHYSVCDISESFLLETICTVILRTGRSVIVDSGVASAVKASLLVNQIEKPTLIVGTNTVYTITPDISLMLVYYAARGKRHKNVLTTYETSVLESFVKSVDDVLSFIWRVPMKPNKRGDLLETAFRNWLSVRIASATYLQNHTVANEPYTAAFILGLPETFAVQLTTKYVDLTPLFDTNLILSRKFDQIHEMKHVSYGDDADKGNYLKELQDVALTNANAEDGGVVSIKPSSKRGAQKEAWDLCLKFFYPQSGKPIYVFFENKSAKVNSKTTQKLARASGLERMHDSAMQYRHTRDVLQPRDVSFLYIYATTYNVESFVEERALQLGGADMQRILGPMYDLYSSFRSKA
jgi:hypothetical protein